MAKLIPPKKTPPLGWCKVRSRRHTLTIIFIKNRLTTERILTILITIIRNTEWIERKDHLVGGFKPFEKY